MFKPTRKDIENIFHYVGIVLIGLGLCMFIPLLVSLVSGELEIVVDFLIAACVTVGVGNILYFSLRPRGRITWNQGLVIVALSWFVSMLFSALPLFLSGNYSSYLDACFEAMSGLTTTGLTLVHDLDHMAYGANLWRHMMIFMGGQGIVVLVITYFMAGSSAAAQMYTGEGRESIMPNVIESSRFIWRVSISYLILGTLALGIALFAQGMAPARSIFQSTCLFMAGFDTGGFTPQDLSIVYYHSIPVEIITLAFIIMGSTNFAVHHEVWKRRYGEVVRNMELRVFSLTLLLILGLVLAGLVLADVFGSFGAVMRRSVYQVVSAHSTTGFTTVYSQQIVQRWGELAFFVFIIAMGLGGCACSTSSAIKSFRVGVLAKDIKLRTKQALSPASAVIVERFHHIKELTLTDTMARAALLITLLYIMSYLLGTVVALLYGYGVSESIFESVSAGSNSGMSSGVTSYTMPVPLKVVFILQMWAGRLEVLAVVVMIAYFLSMLRRGRK